MLFVLLALCMTHKYMCELIKHVIPHECAFKESQVLFSSINVTSKSSFSLAPTQTSYKCKLHICLCLPLPVLEDLEVDVVPVLESSFVADTPVRGASQTALPGFLHSTHLSFPLKALGKAWVQVLGKLEGVQGKVCVCWSC